MGGHGSLAPQFRFWRLGPQRTWVLDRPRFLGILNLTPDSFSDGGRFDSAEAAVQAGLDALDAGADGLDLGGESTRPGAQRMPAEIQIRRVLPVMRRLLKARPQASLSIDTTLSEVAAAALDAGAVAINDVSAGMEDPGMLPLAARAGCGVVLMHRLRPPDGDSFSHQYAVAPDYLAGGGVVSVVERFLAGRAAAAIAAGVDSRAILIDPGLGFGKTVMQNLDLIRATPRLADLGYPILSALSRKSFVAKGAGIDPDLPPVDRDRATVVLSQLHLRLGASVFRVHDVPGHVRTLRPNGS